MMISHTLIYFILYSYLLQTIKSYHAYHTRLLHTTFFNRIPQSPRKNYYFYRPEIFTNLYSTLKTHITDTTTTSAINHNNKKLVDTDAAEDKLEQSINKIKERILINTSDEPLFFNLGLLLKQKVDCNTSYLDKELVLEAITAFNNALKLNPNREASWFCIANLKELLNDSHNAILAYKEVIKISKDNNLPSVCYNNIIQLLLTTNKIEEAAKISNEACISLPNDDIAWCNMGVILIKNRSYDMARSCFENSLKLSEGQNVIAMNNLGNVYLQNNEIDLALDTYNEAIQLDPYDESSHYNLAIILRDTQKYELSKKMFEKCLEINPYNSVATFQLKALIGDSSTKECPSSYISDLFDHYATHDYDDYMVNDLNYKVPEYIWNAYISTNIKSDANTKCSTNDIMTTETMKSTENLTEQLTEKALENMMKKGIIEKDMKKVKPLVIVELGVGTGLVGVRFRKGFNEMKKTNKKLNQKRIDKMNEIKNEKRGRRMNNEINEMESENDLEIIDYNEIDVIEYSGCDLSSEMIIKAFELMYDTSSDGSSNDDSNNDSNDDSNSNSNNIDENINSIDNKSITTEEINDSVGTDNTEINSIENIYTNLIISDCTEYLKNRIKFNNKKADLILAGDVLVYIGELDTLFSCVKLNLGRDGRFIFSVEKLVDNYNYDDSQNTVNNNDKNESGNENDGNNNNNRNENDNENKESKNRLNMNKKNDVNENNKNNYILQKTARFAHNKKYIEKLASKYDLNLSLCNELSIRYDGVVPLLGYVFVLENK